MGRIATAAVTIVLAAACGAQASPTPTARPQATATDVASSASTARTVVIDTDMAPDDWLAILYLLGRPEVDVAAITVTGAGEARCAAGVKNALELAALAGKPDIPVACGRETPLVGEHVFPTGWRDAVDSLLGLRLPDNPNGPAPGSAVDLLTSTISSAPSKVTLITLGPLTNIAEALQESPDLAGKIEATYIMGGAVKVDGNVGVSGVGIDNQAAEWNIYVDPSAAQVVLDADVHVVLVPLDATNQVPITTGFADRLAADVNAPEAQFASDVITQRADFVASGTYYFWDPLAAAVLIDESLSMFETANLSVIVDEGSGSGGIIESADGAPTRYATSADLARLEQLLIDTWNGRIP